MKRNCVVCGTASADAPIFPKGKATHCFGCWEKRCSAIFSEQGRFRLKRIVREDRAEQYVVFHDRNRWDDPCAEVIAIHGDGRVLFDVLLHPTLPWSEDVPIDPCWKLGRWNGRGVRFLDLLVDEVCELGETLNASEWRMLVNQSDIKQPDPLYKPLYQFEGISYSSSDRG